MREWATLAGSVVWLLGLCSLGPQISDLPMSLSGWQSGPVWDGRPSKCCQGSELLQGSGLQFQGEPPQQLSGQDGVLTLSVRPELRRASPVAQR